MCDRILDPLGSKDPNQLETEGLINILMTKGNVPLKHQIIPLVSLDATQLATAITVDDDISLFKKYIHRVCTNIALKAICHNAAGYCSIWMIQHRLGEINDEWYFQLFNCGLAMIAAYPDKDVQIAALYEFYNYLKHDRHAGLRLDLYVANNIVQNTALRVNWNSGLPDNYRGQYYWYTVDLNSQSLEPSDIVHLWRSIFSHWDHRAFDHEDGNRSRHRLLTFMSHQTISKQYLAIRSIDYTEFQIIVPYLEHFYRLDDYGHILLPKMPFSIQYFNLIEKGYTSSSPSPWSYYDKCLLLHLYGPWMQHIRSNFTTIIEALDDTQVYSRLSATQLKIVSERLYEFWKSCIIQIPKDSVLPNGWMYMRHIPLLKYGGFTMELANTNHEVRTALVAAIEASESLGQIPSKYLPLFIGALPQLITVREFRFYPSLVIQYLEDYDTGLDSGLDSDLVKEIASYLFTMDRDSPLLDHLGWKECVKLIMQTTRADQIQMLKSCKNFTKRFCHVLAYYFHDHPDNIYTVDARSCLYGLETYGQCISTHILNMCQTLLQQVPLPPLTITAQGFTDPSMNIQRQIRLLLALYEQNSLSNLLKLDLDTFLEFVDPVHDDMSYLHNWIVSNGSSPRFNVSSIVWSTCNTSWVKLMIEHGIVDHDTVRTDDPVLSEYIDGIIQCPICYDIIYETDMLTTSCVHKFHQVCLERWLSAHDSCPVCRAILNNTSVSDSISGSGFGSSSSSSSSNVSDFWV
jgi:hypothetical protein